MGGAGRGRRGGACANRRLGIDAEALEARLGAGWRGGPRTEWAGPKLEDLKEDQVGPSKASQGKALGLGKELGKEGGAGLIRDTVKSDP